MTGKLITEDRAKNQAWMDLIDACTEVPGGVPCEQAPDLFFPVKATYKDRDVLTSDASHTMLAKQACKGCPVRDMCADYAITYREEFGIWGGTTFFERKKLWDRRPVGRQPKKK